MSEENAIYKKQNIKKDNYRRKSDLENNEVKDKFKANTNENNNNSKFQKYPVEHIYNNNYFTLSSTKNIFMFTPNKDSIIYKHRKINNDANEANNNPGFNKTKEIYYKPKIPYLINSNKKKISDNNLFFSVAKENQRNEFNLNIEKDNIGNNYINNSYNLNKNIKPLNTYTIKSRKRRKNDVFDDININLRTSKDDSDIRHIDRNNLNLDNNDNGNNKNNNDNKISNIKNEINEYHINNNNKNKVNINNKEIFIKKKKVKINNDERNMQHKEKEKVTENINEIVLRNNSKIMNSKTTNDNKNKTDIKEIEIEKINGTIGNNIHNDIKANNNSIKNNTYTGNRDIRRRKYDIINKEINLNGFKIEEKLKKNSIQKEEDNEKSLNNDKLIKEKNTKEDIIKKESKIEDKNENEKNIKKEEIQVLEIQASSKDFFEYRR